MNHMQKKERDERQKKKDRSQIELWVWRGRDRLKRQEKETIRNCLEISVEGERVVAVLDGR